MKPRQRVAGALARGTFDRLPIKHLAVAQVDRRLSEQLGVSSNEDLLDRLGHDFREIRPVYRGPDFGNMDSEHGCISGTVLARSLTAQRPSGLADIDSPADLESVSFEFADWYDYSSVRQQCADAANYATILGYCEGDFINGQSGLRGGFEQVYVDIGLAEPVYIEMIERRFRAVFAHLERVSLPGRDGSILSTSGRILVRKPRRCLACRPTGTSSARSTGRFSIWPTVTAPER